MRISWVVDQDNDFTPRVSFFAVADRCRSLAERVGSIDDGEIFPRLIDDVVGAERARGVYLPKCCKQP
ncbi:MAG TPA: hypothetical protein VGD62_11035 [Acidobacteriaceae bacterium]